HAAAMARRAGHRDGPESASAAGAARIALALVDTCPAPGYAARVAPVVARVRALWYEPDLHPLAHLDRGYRSGIEDGEPVPVLDRLAVPVRAFAAVLTRLAGEPVELTVPPDLPPVARAVLLIAAELLGDHPLARSVPPGDDDGSFLSAVAAGYHALAVAAEYP